MGVKEGDGNGARKKYIYENHPSSFTKAVKASEKHTCILYFEFPGYFNALRKKCFLMVNSLLNAEEKKGHCQNVHKQPINN